MNSENARKQLMFVGLDMFKENLIYGSGAGGFVMKMSQRNTNSSLAKRLTVNAHNYLLELLVDFGLLILIPAVWIIILFWRGIEKLDRDSTIEIIIFGITLLAGTVMVSSLVYFIPVYLIFYLVFIKVCSEHDSCASANI
jgi:O-antigen ligase